jgi:hypothetical protein
MSGINKDALFEDEMRGLSAAEQRKKRHEYDPYSRKAIRQSLQQMIMGALHELGGQRWLVRQADKYPVAFMALVAKNLPFEARKPHEDGVRIVVITSGNGEVVKEDAPGVLNSPLKLVSRRVVENQVSDAEARELDPLDEGRGFKQRT